MKILSVLLCTLLSSFMLLSAADEVYVPPDLRDWRQWVLHDSETLACPVAGESRSCVWPGRLVLNINDAGGRFEQRVEVFAEQFFMLPGGRDSWPSNVTVDGQRVPVVERGGRPTVRLLAGDRELRGEFSWTRAPDTVLIGNGTGLIALTVDGKRVERPRWDHRMVWVGDGQTPATRETQDQMSVSVYRKVTDGAPVTMAVHLKIDIAGESREETIGRLVPEGFSPASMVAPLPARLDDDGDLKIQARPGNWLFKFEARISAPLERLVFAPAGEHWPADEVWSFAANPTIRAAEASGENPVDPVQAGVPNDWQNLPAFRMTAGDALQIIERQRGRAAGESNHLQLKRELWLDFDRDGYTARDTVMGSMVRDWRLDMLAPFDLKSARLTAPNGVHSDLLITARADEGQQRGIEVRTPQVHVQALSRMVETGDGMPVGGWDTRFDDVQTTLYLPPGHRLIRAAGADRDAGAWLSRWDLLDFFLVLVITVAVWRMFAPWVGVVALIALMLSLHEPGAPQFAWLNLIAALALAKYLPDGRVRWLAEKYRLLSFLIVVFLLLPFAAQELRAVVFPQLERSVSAQYGGDTSIARSTVDFVKIRPARDMANIDLEGGRGIAAISKEARSTLSGGNLLNRYDKNARVQTGPGVPSWSWHRYGLSWSGPVEVAQTTRLWIASPWMMRLWRVLMVSLLAVLLGAFVRHSVKLTSPFAIAPALVAAAMAFGATGLLNPPVSHAQTPDPKILDELRERLLTPPECVPRCVDISRARVLMASDTLTIEVIAHAQTHAVVPLPGQTGAWMPTQVTLDGRVTNTLSLQANNVLNVHVQEGVHRIKLTGKMPNANSVVVAFPLIPRQISVDGAGWEVTGIADQRLSGGALTLIRQQNGRDSTSLDAIDVEQFPAFVEIHRRLVFDLDWSVQTTIYRRTPPNAAINLAVPLIAGESVTQDNIDVKDGVARISLPTGQQQFRWSSKLDRVPGITLQAGTDTPWQEHWELVVGASWRLEHDGVPELNINRSGLEYWLASFTPWPGEALQLHLSRPASVEGATMAIDRATLSQTVGKRSSESQLSFEYRATRGNQHLVSLPPNAELTSVKHDQRELNLALETGELRLPVAPGIHSVEVRWRSAVDDSYRSVSDRVYLGIAASNLTANMNLSASRWVLWTSGPRLGPAVLYWSELIVFIGLALVLARFGGTPLKFVHWLLLGLGFSTFFWPSFAIVAFALLALAWREKHVQTVRWAFNLSQLFLLLLVVAAAMALIASIPMGLLGSPDMHVSGHNSSATHLRWFADRSQGAMPVGSVISAPIWVYKSLILVWALWLAFALLRWVPWMWSAFSKGGYWRTKSTVEV